LVENGAGAETEVGVGTETGVGAGTVTEVEAGTETEVGAGVRAEGWAEVKAGATAERLAWRRKFPWFVESSRREAGIIRDEDRFPGGQRLDSLWLDGQAACIESNLQSPASVDVLLE
jgi:hypothetical protein